MRYTTQSRVEAYLNRELTDNEASYIDDLIVHVSQFIDNYTGRSWIDVDDEATDADADSYVDHQEATTRIFDGSGSKELYVDEFTNLEKIEVLDSLGSVYHTHELNTDWNLFPSNNDVKQSIRLYGYHFPDGYGNIRVTAVWGGRSTPQSIIMVATGLVSKYLLKMHSGASQFKKESIEGYSVEYLTSQDIDSDTKILIQSLDMHRRILL